MGNKYIYKVTEISLKNKYVKWYTDIIKKAKSRKQNRKELKKEFGYVEKHHILPKSFNLGGENDRDNFVFLTAKEHFIVHLIATKMFKGEYKSKMIFAFRGMWRINPDQKNRYVNSKLYEKIKPEWDNYIRLYKDDSILYIHKTNKDKMGKLIQNGWSKMMTEEYKKGRVGNMKGKTHSDETKLQMSKSSQEYIKKNGPHALGRKRSKEEIEKAKKTLKENKLLDPQKYKDIQNKRTRSFKESYSNGNFIIPGFKGKTMPKSARETLSEKAKLRWKDLKNDPEAYEQKRKQMKESKIRYWENIPKENRKRERGTAVFKKFGITEKVFFEKRVRPLLYYGLTHRSIANYDVKEIGETTIKKIILNYGSDVDIKQWESNKKRLSGSSPKAIEFVKSRYQDYLKTQK